MNSLAYSNFNTRDGYKANKPKETIKKIRDILYENNIFVIEDFWNDAKYGMSSVSLCIPGLPCRTNGKSFNESYALASAYGEFMERLQNLTLLNQHFCGNQPLNTLRPPDSTPFNYWKFKADHPELVKIFFCQENLKKIENILSKQSLYAIPFYHLNSKKSIYLPHETLTQVIGSNGMCAGNTPEEALIQGLCEIFERYVLKLIHETDTLFPVIPENYFASSPQRQYIKLLKENGCEIFIKDCSLGGKLPVIGVIIKKMNRATFHLGAAPDYTIAFERCITELFQGRNIEQLDQILHPIMPMTTEYFNRSFSSQEKANKYSFQRSLVGHKGLVPLMFFNNEAEFNENNLFSSNNFITKDVLQNLINICHQMQWEVFIRDVSFLGFPAYWIYIPGVSEVDKINYEYLEFIYEKLPKARRIFYNMGNSSSRELQYLSDVIKQMMDDPYYEYNKILRQLHKLHLRRETGLTCTDPENLLVLIHCKLGEYQTAHELLQAYLQKNLGAEELDDPPSYALEHLCLLHYLKHLANGHSLENSRQALIMDFAPEIVNGISELLKEPIKIQEILELPNCQDCTNCDHKDICSYEKMLGIINHLQDKMSQYHFDQTIIEQWVS